MNEPTENVSKRYLGEQGEEYARGVGQNVTSHLGHLLQSRYFTPFFKKGDKVLDFGCGHGAIAQHFKAFEVDVSCVEVNPWTREIARKRGLTVYETVHEIPEDLRFDIVTSNHVLEHIPNVVGVLRELKKVMKPGGKIVLSLPINDFRCKDDREWRADDPNHHLHTWTPLLIGNTFVEAGLRPIEAKVITSAWTPKLFFLGDSVLQKIAGMLFARLKKRRHLLAVAAADDGNENDRGPGAERRKGGE